MAKTIIGIFDDQEEARTAVRQLSEAGIKQGDISIAKNEAEKDGYSVYGGEKSTDYDTGESIGDSISDFFSNMFGGDDDEVRGERELYSESVRRGSTAVTVNAEDNMSDKVADIMNTNGAIDIDRRAAKFRQAGYKGYDETAKPYTAEQTQTERKNFNEQGEVALPVIEETLNVGKRVVNRGGVRVHTGVSEREVSEQVNLRQENVNVERRDVNREVSADEMKNFKEGEFEVKTKGEEAVVDKTAKVVEEVVIGKNVNEKTETVSGTVKKTDVDVEEINTDKSNKARNS